MEVVNSTSIVEPDSLLEPGAQVDEAKSRDDASKTSDSHGDSSSDHQVRSRSDGNTSSQSSVKDDFHLKNSVFNSANRSSSEGTGGNSQDGVDDDTLLLVLTCQGSVETGPEHEQE